MTDVNIDKVFKAYDVRGTYPDQLNEDLAWKIGHAAAQFLRMNLTGPARSDVRKNMVIVGRDMRLSSPSLCSALIEGIRSTGTNCIDIGMIDTPQIYFAINHLAAAVAFKPPPRITRGITMVLKSADLPRGPSAKIPASTKSNASAQHCAATRRRSRAR